MKYNSLWARAEVTNFSLQAQIVSSLLKLLSFAIVAQKQS